MSDYIQSRSNPVILHLKKLRSDKDYREECRSVLITGKKVIEELASHLPIKLFIYDIEKPNFLDIRATRSIATTASAMKEITGLLHPDGYAAEVALPISNGLKECSRLLVCDAVSDPGNMGTLFRTALALKWDGLFLLPGCSDPYNDKALRAARGAPLVFPHRQGSWQQLLDYIKIEGLTPLIADTQGQPLSEMTRIPNRLALIIGNEGHGVLSPQAFHKLSIPMNPMMESLNVSIAASILMYALNLSKPHG